MTVSREIPRPLALAVELNTDDDEHRYMDCSGYLACLEHAAQAGLTSWSCAMCRARRKVVEYMAPASLEILWDDYIPSACVVYDPLLKKVVAGSHLVCHALDCGVDAILVALVAPAQCPMCYTTLWGDDVVVGRRGCSAGHTFMVSGDGDIVTASGYRTGRKGEQDE